MGTGARDREGGSKESVGGNTQMKPTWHFRFKDPKLNKNKECREWMKECERIVKKEVEKEAKKMMKVWRRSMDERRE